MGVILVSGGFDPLHVGHLRYLVGAAQLRGSADKLVVALNSDAWLMRKKGYVFMGSAERKEILNALSCVDRVWVQEWDGDHMAPAIRYWNPIIFAKGGDRASARDLPWEEIEACLELGVQVRFGIGGFDKPDSSQELVRRATLQRTPQQNK